MFFCALLLQMPLISASSKDIVGCLQRRLPLWKQSNIDDLLLECCNTAQHQLSTIVPAADCNERLICSFVSHVLHGNVRVTLALFDTIDHPGVPQYLSDPVSPDNSS